MTNHTNCLHPATSAGRASCRKAGSVADFHFNLAEAIAASAPCSSCFAGAMESATQNLDEDLGSIAEDADPDTFHIRRAQEAIHAREYLFDRSSLSACYGHQELLS